ncbi:MAG: hypothetical protein ACYDBZ_00830 [Steroidobacteraceae bacterium]
MQGFRGGLVGLLPLQQVGRSFVESDARRRLLVVDRLRVDGRLPGLRGTESLMLSVPFASTGKVC